jgi:cytochrome c peroxidase
MIRSGQARLFYGPCVLLGLLLAGCGGGGGGADSVGTGSAAVLAKSGTGAGKTDLENPPVAPLPPVAPSPPLQPVDVGSRLFKDPSLSASGKMACASCHAEASGHADAPGTSLPKGGANLDLAGMRSSPTVRYLNENPEFTIDKKGNARGGFTWDGRANTRKDQARDPFFVPVEMALPGNPNNPSALTALVRQAPYFPDLQALYRPDQIDTDLKLFDKITELLAIYQREDTDYNRFDSKFDLSLRGEATLSVEERRGLAIMSDPKRGNCLSCHTAVGPKPLFTNFAFAALGVPRNHKGPKNANPEFYDLGLCVRERESRELSITDKKNDGKYCGQFKTPTLRNVERTAPYFHNASVTSLEEAVRFHFERDRMPTKWYRTREGGPDVKYNDLPNQYTGNIVRGRPFTGDYMPSNGDIADILAFLKTLNDADQTEPIPPR